MYGNLLVDHSSAICRPFDMRYEKQASSYHGVVFRNGLINNSGNHNFFHQRDDSLFRNTHTVAEVLQLLTDMKRSLARDKTKICRSIKRRISLDVLPPIFQWPTLGTTTPQKRSNESEHQRLFLVTKEIGEEVVKIYFNYNRFVFPDISALYDFLGRLQRGPDSIAFLLRAIILQFRNLGLDEA